MLQVWFQNRRAKWRRQEKMEAARLGISEYHHGVNTLSRVPGAGLSLPMDPWLTPPLLSALPGFLSHPQTGYPSYLTPPVVASVMDTVNNMSLRNTSPTIPSPTNVVDSQSTSIAALRLKAKEHADSIVKSLHNIA